MDCQCYQIGGPFIGADPHCPRHGPGGTLEQELELERLQEEVAELRQENADLKARLEKLERKLC